MKSKRWVALACASVMVAGLAAGCGSGGNGNSGNAGNTPAPSTGNTDSTPAPVDNKPFHITIATSQVDEIPAQDSEIQLAIQKYTNTTLDMQWIPSSAYNDKINVMIASDEMPMAMRVQNVPTTISAIQSGLFWEIGPLLKDYKNLSAQNPQFYANVEVDGKVYGLPLYRDIGRAAFIFRKDWMDNLGLKQPTTVDEYYNVLKAMTLNDPDKNGKNDTFGILLHKKYVEGSAAATTRLAVSLGAPNKWEVDANGKFKPEFEHPVHLEVMKMFRKLYADKAINQDFAAVDESETLKVYDSGRAGVRIAVAQNAGSQSDRTSQSDPNAVFDVEALKGPQGIRVSGETGNNGYYVFPKSKVKTEEDLKKILAFFDKLLDPEMNTLLRRGVENKHFVNTSDGKHEWKDFALFQREVKPYRDMLLNMEGYNINPLKDKPVAEKAQKIAEENTKYTVPNPALTLTSATYSERGGELERLIYDAQIKFIMGKTDEAGYQADIAQWHKQGGDKIIQEYEEAYAKNKK
jgi:putative aldouronate transport system substrate-binding protein